MIASLYRAASAMLAGLGGFAVLAGSLSLSTTAMADPSLPANCGGCASSADSGNLCTTALLCFGTKVCTECTCSNPTKGLCK